MKNTIDRAVYRTTGITRKGNTVWKINQSKIPVRYPSSSGYKRNISDIALEEIAQAICYLLRDSFSLNESETILYAGKIFGFTSVSGKSKDCVLEALKLLTSKGIIINKNERFSLRDRNNFKLNPN